MTERTSLRHHTLGYSKNTPPDRIYSSTFKKNYRIVDLDTPSLTAFVLFASSHLHHAVIERHTQSQYLYTTPKAYRYPTEELQPKLDIAWEELLKRDDIHPQDQAYIDMYLIDEYDLPEEEEAPANDPA